MENITMTMNAVTCVLSVRPRLVNRVFMADLRAEGQGTTVSTVALAGLGTAVFGAPVNGDVSVIAPTYTTTDVACFRSGRPPV
jgi:hypothetical protein